MPNISKPASYNGGWVRGLEQLLSVTITQPFGQWLSQVLKSEWVSLKSFSNVVETKYLMLAWTNYCWTVFPSTHKKLWWVSGTFFNKEYFLFLETHTHWQVLVSGPFFWVFVIGIVIAFVNAIVIDIVFFIVFIISLSLSSFGLHPCPPNTCRRQPSYNQLPLWGKSIQQPGGVAGRQLLKGD